jgi:hypothetical protein
MGSMGGSEQRRCVTAARGRSCNHLTRLLMHACMRAALANALPASPPLLLLPRSWCANCGRRWRQRRAPGS